MKIIPIQLSHRYRHGAGEGICRERCRLAAGRRERFNALLLFSFFFLPALSLLAQQRADPVAIGMGRSSVATARGLSALYSNIGALGLDALGKYDSLQDVEIDLSFLPVGVSAGSTYLNSSELDFVFDKKDSGIFTDADRLRLAGLLEEGRLSADAAADIVELRIRAPRIGAIGIRYGHRVRARMSFPENFRTGVLGSGDVFSQGQTFENPEIGGEWTRSLNVTLATAFERRNTDKSASEFWMPAFGVGMSLGYMEGIVHYDVDPKSWARTEVIPSPPGATYRSIGVSGYYTFRSSQPIDSTFNASDAILSTALFDRKVAAADGWEGGLGISVVILRKLKEADVEIVGSPLEAEKVRVSDNDVRDALLFGITLEGMGGLNWFGSNRERRYPNISDTLTDELGGVSNDVIYRYEAKLDTIGTFRSRLPMQMRMGLGADLTAFFPAIAGDLVAGVEAAFDLNDQIGSEGAPRVSIGGEWKPSQEFAVRTGFQFGGDLGVAMSAGIGFRPLRWLMLDVATSELTSLFFSDRRRLDLALRLSTQIRM